MSLINEFLKKDTSVKIAVVGDSAIDEYFLSKITRISPEAPIPVLLSENEKPNYIRPGCAANVVYQFSNFNVEVNLISLLDIEAKEILNNHKINTSLCVEIPNKIPRKRRFYADGFPIYRWDVEQENYGFSDELLKKYSMKLYDTVASGNFDVIIYSDYGKGAFYSWLGIPHRFNNKVCSIVDPKNTIDKWYGCTVFKPNKAEAFSLSGHNTIENAAWFFNQKLGCNSVITNGNNPVTVFNAFAEKMSKIGETVTNQAKSVVGGGDTFSCFLAMAIARGFSIEESTEIAWLAGTRYVQNRYNKPLYPLDLIQTKIISNPAWLKERDYNLVFANGCFDAGLTKAHVELLKFAKKQGDKLVVALNGDESIKKNKGVGRPIMPFEERAIIVAGLECVDFVVEFKEETPLEVLKQIMPNFIVKGGDYKADEVIGKDLAKVIIGPRYESMSTTDKLRAI